MLPKIALLTLAFSSIANFALGYIVFSKNPSGNANRIFGLLCLALVGWSTAEYLSIVQGVSTDFTVTFLVLRFVFSFVALQNLLFFLFIAVFPGHRLTINKYLATAITIFGLIVVVLPFSGPFFAEYDQKGLLPGPGMMVLMLSILFFAIAGFVLLRRKLRLLSGQEKNQARYLLVAAFILWVVVPICDFVLPTMFGLRFAYALSPLLSLLFAITIFYGIVKQRLFDIRPIAARSVSYILFLLTLLAAYAAFAFGLSSLFISK